MYNAVWRVDSKEKIGKVTKTAQRWSASVTVVRCYVRPVSFPLPFLAVIGAAAILSSMASSGSGRGICGVYRSHRVIRFRGHLLVS